MVNFTLEQVTKTQGWGGGVEIQLFFFSNLGARWGKWSMPRLGHFTPGKGLVLFVQEAGWAPGPVWTGEKNLDPHRQSILGPFSP
jgi:hypothetical protein